jgi:hypothetical protein
MNCHEAQDLLTESLVAPLSGRAAADLAAHLAACDACRAEAQDLRRVWKELERLPEEMPGEEMTRRFAANLEPHLLAAHRRGRPRRLWDRLAAGLEGWLDSWLPHRPLAQAGLAAAALLVGALAGHGFAAGGGGQTGQLGALRDEVRSLSQLVTLSLLKEDSASERLRGVSFGRQAGTTDDRVLAALLDTLGRDPDVNVRLAAVDALAPAVGRPPVRDQLLSEVGRQRSPMVQIALIDVLLAHDRAGARPRLLELAEAPALDATVRDYLRSRLRPLT